jgi:nickel/cobalt transporter (NicO) family protein
MNYSPELLLVAAVATVGVLHTIVPDHWVPITLIARQRGWSKSETARAALQAGIGHVLSTLLIALVVWLAGVAFAQRFGHAVDTISSLALIAFGGWFAISAWRDLRMHGGHGHS